MTKDDRDPRSSAPAVEMYCAVCDTSYPEDANHCPKDGSKLVRLTEKVDPFIGRVLDDRFTIRSRLGSGGMGTVYRALQHSVGREVAIKVIEPKLARVKDVTKRFLREMQLSSRLSQPNTVTVLDFGQTDDGLLYLVMELLVGQSLDRIIETQGAMPENRVIRIGIQICDALDAAQNLQIVHRDLKPGNVVILDEPPGRDMTKVLDFGIAKSLAGEDSGITTMTRSDMILGTPSYIAPEAVVGGKVDGRADLYSLGVMLYEMVSGKLPFSATTVNKMLASHTSEKPRVLPDTVSPELRDIILRLLLKDPDQRFQTAAQVRAALTTAQRRVSHNSSAIAATMPPVAGAGTQRPDTDESGGIAHASTAATPIGMALASTTPAGDTGGGHRPGDAAQAMPFKPWAPWKGQAVPPGQTLEPLQKKSRAPLWIGLGLALVGGGAFALMSTGDDSAAPTASPGSTESTASAPESTTAATASVEGATASTGDTTAEADGDPTGVSATAKAGDTTATAPAEDTAKAGDTTANAPATGASPAAKADEQVHFRLDSIPRGAKVILRQEDKADDVLCESTPCFDVRRPKAPAYGELWFYRDGFEPKRRARVDLLRAKHSDNPVLRRVRKRPGAQEREPSDEGFIPIRKKRREPF